MGPFTAWAIILRHALTYHAPRICQRTISFTLLPATCMTIVVALALSSAPTKVVIVRVPDSATIPVGGPLCGDSVVHMTADTAYTRSTLFKMLAREGFIRDRTHYPPYSPFLGRRVF